MEWLIGLVAVVAIFIILPTTLSGHITQNARHKRDKEVEKMQLQKEMLALEVEKEKAQLLRLEAENKHYDRALDADELRQFDQRLKAGRLEP